jgi:hypothetical protein
MSEVMPADDQLRDEIDQLRAELDQLGEKEVRELFARGVYGERKRRIVAGWLAQQAEKKQDDTQERQEAREDEVLALARRANWISCFAAAFAFVAIIVSMFK